MTKFQTDSGGSAGQSADLRTRIAAALLGDHCVQGMTAPCDDCRAHALRQADAVIRELGLEPERRVGPGEPGEGLSGFIRYVTGWEVDD